MVDSPRLGVEAGESWGKCVFERTFRKVFWVQGGRVGLMGAGRGYSSVLLAPSEPEEVAEPVGDQAAGP